MARRHLDRMELPDVCITCGEAGGLTPREIEFGYVSRQDELLSTLFSLLGFFYHRELIYTLKVPMCAGCAGRRRRSRIIIVLMFPGIFAALFGAFAVTSDPVPLVALPAAVLVASCVSYLVLRAKGEPKAVEVNDKRLVVRIPRHGEFTIYDEAPAPLKFTRSTRATPAPRPEGAKAAAPRLNRSVCHHCGFINFAGVSDCKKCGARLGSEAAAM